MGSGILHRVLTGRLQLLFLAVGSSLSLNGQVIWDDSPALKVVRFREDPGPTSDFRLADPVRERPTRIFNQPDAGWDTRMGAALAETLRVIPADLPASASTSGRASSRGEPSVDPVGRPPSRSNGRAAALVSVARRPVGTSATPSPTAAVPAYAPLAAAVLPDSEGGLSPSISPVSSGGVSRLAGSGLTPVTLSGPPVAVAHYPFTGNSLASTDTDPFSTASSLSLVGLSPYGFDTGGNPGPSLRIGANPIPNSFSPSSYLSFTITPNPGHALNLNSLSLDAAIVNPAGSYTGFFEVRSSVDGFTAAVLSGTITSISPTFTSYSTTLGPSFVNLPSTEFRIYLWDSNEGKKRAVLVDNIHVMGNSVVIPEPPSWLAAAALGGVALAMEAWRRHTPADAASPGTGTPPQRT